jgi:hypothetical protein
MSYQKYAKLRKFLKDSGGKEPAIKKANYMNMLKGLADQMSGKDPQDDFGNYGRLEQLQQKRDSMPSFGGSIGGEITGGIGSMMASPFTAIAKGVETAVDAPATTFGYRLNKMMNRGFGGLMDRIEAPDLAAKRFIESASSNMAEAATGLLADMSSKAISGLTDAMVDAPARKAILAKLRMEDPIISKMTEQDALDAFHSIAKFAPNLAKDKNAVRSALRLAAQSEGGLSFHTIKGLAEAEAAIAKSKSF